MVSLGERVEIPPDVLFRELDGEAVILNLETGQYYGLDAVGTRMWLLIREHGKLEAVCRAMLEEYEVEEERLRQDLVQFVDALAAQQLLRVAVG